MAPHTGLVADLYCTISPSPSGFVDYRTAIILYCTAFVDERIIKERFAQVRMGKDKGCA